MTVERSLGELLALLPPRFYLKIQVEEDPSDTHEPLMILGAVLMETPPEEGWTIPTYFDEPPGVKRAHTEEWLEKYRHDDVPRIGTSVYPDEKLTFETLLIHMLEVFLKKKGLLKGEVTPLQEPGSLVSMTKSQMYELHGMLHTLWSKAVGTSDYDKKQWGKMEELISKAISTMLGTECSSGGYLRLIMPKAKP